MFSVIISIYKVEKYLRQCIESVLDQTYTDFELILVDDGSPDSCPQICDEYAVRDKRVRVIHKENGGLMSTRKVGVSEAKGQYVCFVDGDDFIHKDMLATYDGVLKESRADIICSGYTEYYDLSASGIQIGQQIPCGVYSKELLCINVYPRMLSSSPYFSFYIKPSVCTKCFNRKMISDIYRNIPDNISLGEDAAATYPALLKSDSIVAIDYFGYYYRQIQTSMTHSYDGRLYEKVKNLLVYLKKTKSDVEWGADRQLNEYAVYLLTLAKNNELAYNCNDDYKTKKRNMLVYLQDDLFSDAIKHVRINGIKNKFVLWCFKHRIILPLFIWSQKNR